MFSGQALHAAEGHRARQSHASLHRHISDSLGKVPLTARAFFLRHHSSIQQRLSLTFNCPVMLLQQQKRSLGLCLPVKC